MMENVTVNTTDNKFGTLTQIVFVFRETHGKRVDAGISLTREWDPLKQYIAVKDFKCVGAHLGELGW